MTLINCYLLVGSESGLKHRAQTVKERLDLAALGGTIWIYYVQHAEDLEESISGKDRAEEGEVGGIISAPVVLQVSCTIPMLSTTAMEPFISSTVTGFQFR